MRELQLYRWPGNVRQLRNVIDRAVILATGLHLTVPLPTPAASAPPVHAPQTLVSFELQHIRATLERTRWRIRGQGGAAELLGLKPTTLESRMAKLGLARPVLPRA
jgi:DNA-binding NtrC family response regulator